MPKTNSAVLSPTGNFSLNPVTFKPFFDGWYLHNYKPESQLVFVKYEGVKRGDFKRVTRFHISLHAPKTEGETPETPLHSKHDILFMARQSDWHIVKPCCKWRKEVREKRLKPGARLAERLDDAKHLAPYALKIKEKKVVRKAFPVRIVLRNGLVITGKILRFDKWQVVVRCKSGDVDTALILVFKHGIHRVERVNSDEK